MILLKSATRMTDLALGSEVGKRQEDNGRLRHGAQLLDRESPVVVQQLHQGRKLLGDQRPGLVWDGVAIAVAEHLEMQRPDRPRHRKDQAPIARAPPQEVDAGRLPANATHTITQHTTTQAHTSHTPHVSPGPVFTLRVQMRAQGQRSAHSDSSFSASSRARVFCIHRLTVRATWCDCGSL